MEECLRMEAGLSVVFDKSKIMLRYERCVNCIPRKLKLKLSVWLYDGSLTNTTVELSGLSPVLIFLKQIIFTKVFFLSDTYRMADTMNVTDFLVEEGKEMGFLEALGNQCQF